MSSIQKPISMLVIFILASLTLCGCIPDEKAVEIQVGKNITSLTIGDSKTAGQSETIEVRALTTKGKSVPFTIETEGNCVSFSSTPASITVIAGTELCEQTLTVKSGSAEEKTITVIVYDPMVMDIGDGLLIRYVNTYTFQWNDKGSGGTHDVSFLHPVADIKNGWFPLGSLIIGNYGATQSIPMIVVKDSKDAGLLATPVEYKWVWDDKGSGASRDGSVWRAVCPEGFVAFGVVTNSGYGQPPLDAIRCVSQKYTAKASIGEFIYNDKGTGANHDLSVLGIDYLPYTVSPDDRAELLTGVSVGCGGYSLNDCDESLVNLLLVPLPVYSHSENMIEPKLSGRTPLDISKPRFFSSVRIPFTLIASEYNNATPERKKLNIEKSPFYYVQREEMYTSIDVLNNVQGKNDAIYHYQIATGYSRTDQEKFSQEFGVKVTAGGECGFLGTGGKWEVELSYKFGWEKSVAKTYSEIATRDFTFTVPANTYAEVVQVTNQFRAIPMTGVPAQGQPFDMNSNIIMYLQYPP